MSLSPRRQHHRSERRQTLQESVDDLGVEPHPDKDRLVVAGQQQWRKFHKDLLAVVAQRPHPFRIYLKSYHVLTPHPFVEKSIAKRGRALVFIRRH
jgi:hypothetical protein